MTISLDEDGYRGDDPAAMAERARLVEALREPTRALYHEQVARSGDLAAFLVAFDLDDPWARSQYADLDENSAELGAASSC
jgi:hypothetical protein